MGFVQRYRQDPTLEQLTSIEQTAIVDIAPPQPGVGQGSGNVLVTAEFEDGPFAAGGDSAGYDPNRRGILEAFTSGDLEQKYGGFGFVRIAHHTVSHPIHRRAVIFDQFVKF